MSIPLHFDRGVLIQNWRLNIFYIFLLIIVLLAALTKALFNEIWLKSVPVIGEVVLSVQGTEDADAIAGVWRTFSQSDACSDPTTYNYVWRLIQVVPEQSLPGTVLEGAEGPALRLEPNGGAANCFFVLAESAPFVSGATNRVFLVTHFQDATYDAKGRNLEAAMNFFAPAVEAISVSIKYTYRLRNQRVTESPYITSDDVPTVILNREEEVLRVVPPGNDVVLTVPELLQLSGMHLDHVHGGAGANALQGAAFTEGPINRIAGLDLVVHVDCYDREVVPVGTQAPLCYLLVKHTDIHWVEHVQRIHAGEGGFRQRTNHGIQVWGQLNGEYLEAHPNNVYIEMAMFFVYLELPTMVVVVVAAMFIGHLSHLYRRAIFKNFSIVEQVSACVLRRLMYKGAFQEVADMKTTDGQATGITKAKMRLYLQEVMALRNHRLDDFEMRWMVNFCFRALSETRKRAAEPPPPKPGSCIRRCCRHLGFWLRQLYVEMLEACGHYRVGVTRFNYNSIDLDAFLLASQLPELMQFYDVVKLFKTRRKVKRLERRFVPLEWKNMLRDCAKDEADDDVHLEGVAHAPDETEESRLAPQTARAGEVERKCRTLDDQIEEIRTCLQQMENDVDQNDEEEADDLGGQGAFGKLANKAALKSSKMRKKQVQSGLQSLKKEVEELANTGKALEERANVIDDLKLALVKRQEALEHRSTRQGEANDTLFDRISAIEQEQFAEVDSDESESPPSVLGAGARRGSGGSPGSGRRGSLISLSEVPVYGETGRRRMSHSSVRSTLSASDAEPGTPEEAHHSDPPHSGKPHSQDHRRRPSQD
eukprot:CAMPEP_0178378436 /NCGR_PEP_ID=MMETSP0689_2-20121128/4428_1 /TAXON_ID=160604 /ORGANISM="Amphidinium massartii, Strain CS-259" /LENGTH=818 /DNA_ID=CAMNT_0019998511 /DNA_START=89 /DNA_END=2543 /DNA_ORIENTATION=-